MEEGDVGGTPVIIRGSNGSGVPPRIATDEPFDLRAEFIRSYERWLRAKKVCEGDFTQSHHIDRAWKEYVSWRDMWLRS